MPCCGRPAWPPPCRTRQFPIPRLRLAAYDELTAGERRWADEQEAAASLESVALQADLTDASGPSDITTAFERAYQRLAGVQAALAAESRHHGSPADLGPVA